MITNLDELKKAIAHPDIYITLINNAEEFAKSCEKLPENLPDLLKPILTNPYIYKQIIKNATDLELIFENIYYKGIPRSEEAALLNSLFEPILTNPDEYQRVIPDDDQFKVLVDNKNLGEHFYDCDDLYLRKRFQYLFYNNESRYSRDESFARLEKIVTKEQLMEAYKSGAVHGALKSGDPSKHLSSDIHERIGFFVDDKSAGSLTQTSKTALNEAKKSTEHKQSMIDARKKK